MGHAPDNKNLFRGQVKILKQGSMGGTKVEKNMGSGVLGSGCNGTSLVGRKRGDGGTNKYWRISPGEGNSTKSTL